MLFLVSSLKEETIVYKKKKMLNGTSCLFCFFFLRLLHHNDHQFIFFIFYTYFLYSIYQFGDLMEVKISLIS